MDAVTRKVDSYRKSLSDRNGFPPTVRQTAEQLDLEVRQVEEALHQMEQLGKIVITDIPAKSIIEFVGEEPE